MKFLLDNNLSPYHAHALNELSKPDGHSVCHLKDKFPANTPDEEWIASLANEGDWAVVTLDRFTKNSVEKEAMLQSELPFFILKKQWVRDHKYWDQAQNLVRWWPSVIDQALRIQGGAAFWVPWKFSGKGKFEVYTP